MSEITVEFGSGRQLAVVFFMGDQETRYSWDTGEQVVLMRYLRQGIPGKDGPPGPPGGALIEKVAGQTLGGHRAVRSAGETEVVYADNRALIADNVIGITTGAAAQGERVDVLNNAPITEPSWNWEPDQAIFLGQDGMLTQDAPEDPDAFTLAIGFALSPTAAMIRIEPPIYPED